MALHIYEFPCNSTIRTYKKDTKNYEYPNEFKQSSFSEGNP